ncbi:hypothetical protein JU84_004442 [Salmonella enterica]|nr:hypothetical protein [Salmonella enterica]
MQFNSRVVNVFIKLSIALGKETLRRLMIKTGLWVPRKQRAPNIQQPRYLEAYFS